MSVHDTRMSGEQCRGTLHAVLIDLDSTPMDTVPDFAVVANAMRADFDLDPLPAGASCADRRH